MPDTPIRFNPFLDIEENSDVFFVRGTSSERRKVDSEEVRISGRIGDSEPAVPSMGEREERTALDSRQRVGYVSTLPTPTLPRVICDEVGMPAVGSLIAERYRVTRVLGEGGMGRVYEVSHLTLPRSFAVKILKPEIASDSEMRSSFFLEAKYASSLQHPNLVSVLDFGKDKKFGAYMVMELVPGRLLSHYIADRNKVTIRRACNIALQVAEAAVYIHNHNIIHCDIKPQNIMLAKMPGQDHRRYRAKLLDFGLAQSFLSKRQESVRGTPEYLAPELARHENPSRRSDIYSLGVLLFELVVGHVPWQGPVKRILRGHADETPQTLSDGRGETVHPALEALVGRALSKQQSHRQPDMGVFLSELRTVMTLLGIGRRSADRSVAAPNRAAAACATFSSLRLPLASIDEHGTIVAANSAFSKFLSRLREELEGSRLQDTAFAKSWPTFDQDLQTACSGDSVGRLVEFERNGLLVRLQMWLEPTPVIGLAALSLYPTY